MIWKVALSMTKGAAPVMLRKMAAVGMSPREFMTLPAMDVLRALNVSERYNIDMGHREDAIFRARTEVAFMEAHKIKGYFLLDDDYPWRLLDIATPPLMLYQLGDCDLSVEHPLSVVGTRRLTAYGADFCAKFVGEMARMFPDLLVVSGLAFGADAVAHKAALESGVKTVGVVAHGLNTIYPAAHRDLAKRILQSGGALLSEYPMGTTPFRGNFLERNRIVAGLSDATIVVESEVKGGAMSTANYAFQFSRDVFALPGRINDKASAGCNYLIRKNKAHLISCAADMLEVTDWTPAGLDSVAQQRSLFPDLEGDPKRIMDALSASDAPMSIDALHAALGVPVSRLMTLLGELEFDGLLIRHPGNRFAPGV